MSAYYNENDPRAAAWLRELIRQNVIKAGDVDERSIEDVRPADLRGYRHCHFFAGVGGWAEALRFARWPSDREVWTGSCPCQPFSAAGQGAAFTDERHLWPAWFHLISECRPASVLGEQVDGAVKKHWLDLVQSDMEGIGYAFAPAVLPAAGVGAPHGRHRLFFVADADGGNASEAWLQRSRQQRQFEKDSRLGGMVHAEYGRPAVEEQEPKLRPSSFWSDCDWLKCTDGKSRPVEPGTFPVAHGVPARLGRLRGYGNAIVPQIAAAFIKSYMQC